MTTNNLTLDECINQIADKIENIFSRTGLPISRTCLPISRTCDTSEGDLLDSTMLRVVYGSFSYTYSLVVENNTKGNEAVNIRFTITQEKNPDSDPMIELLRQCHRDVLKYLTKIDPTQTSTADVNTYTKLIKLENYRIFLGNEAYPLDKGCIPLLKEYIIGQLQNGLSPSKYEISTTKSSIKVSDKKTNEEVLNINFGVVRPEKTPAQAEETAHSIGVSIDHKIDNPDEIRYLGRTDILNAVYNLHITLAGITLRNRLRTTPDSQMEQIIAEPIVKAGSITTYELYPPNIIAYFNSRGSGTR